MTHSPETLEEVTAVHKIEFDVKKRRDGSIEVRHKWVHDVGEPHETTVQSAFRRYESADDIAREVTYFLSVAEHYGEATEAKLREELANMDPEALKLLSYMVIDIWSENTVEQRSRKIANKRRFTTTHRAIHDAIRGVFRKHPRLTYGEILTALEREYGFFRNAISSKMDMVDAWKIGKRRRGTRRTP